MCIECRGSRTIERPKEKVYQRLERAEVVNNKVRFDYEIVTAVIGGTDICPTCVARAEAEYQGRANVAA
jgi:hypothetical protein